MYNLFSTTSGSKQTAIMYNKTGEGAIQREWHEYSDKCQLVDGTIDGPPGDSDSGNRTYLWKKERNYYNTTPPTLTQDGVLVT